MEPYVPLEKRSKRARKEYHSAQRGSWNGVNPISRTVPSKKRYDRKKQKQADHRSPWERGSACFHYCDD